MLGTPQDLRSIPLPMPTSREVRCLLLDDSSFDRARIRRMSRETDLLLVLDEVDTIAAFQTALSRDRYELVLIDYRLPVGDGIEALESVLKSSLNKFAGKVMITGDTSEEAAVEAMRAGCHDFIKKKEMDSSTLRKAITNALTRSREALFFLGRPPQNALGDQGGLAADDFAVDQDTSPVFPGRSSDGQGIDPAEVEALLAELRMDDKFHLN